MKKSDEHSLEYLLDFDGRRHFYKGGYWLKFEIKRVGKSALRPHGLDYSFTLHGPDGTRLIGFDNAHPVPSEGSRFKKPSVEADHWHRTQSDPGRPYKFKNAEKLIDDFFNEVERVLTDHGIPFDVIRVDERR